MPGNKRMGRTELLPFTPMAQNELYMRSWFDRRSSGQLCSALGTTASQDLAAVGGSHSLAEAMDLLAVELLGLIGTFRCPVETPPVRFPSALRRHLLNTPGDRRRSKHISAYL